MVKIILKDFQWNLNELKCLTMFAIIIVSLKKVKYYVFEKILSLSFVSSTCGHEYEKVI